MLGRDLPNLKGPKLPADARVSLPMSKSNDTRGATSDRAKLQFESAHKGTSTWGMENGPMMFIGSNFPHPL